MRPLKSGILGFLLFASAAIAQQSEPPVIERVDIRGNRRIPEDTIRFYIQSRPGDTYEPASLGRDLRALHKANFFETISVEERDGDKGKIITFVLKEKPLIRSIEYVGAKSFTESQILEHFKTRKVGLTVDSQYEPAKIRLAERALKELMEQNGKPLGTVRTEVENVPPSSVRIRFIIDEGPKVRIGQIRFTGNKVFDDAELADALKLTKERGLKSVFKGTDKFHKDKLDADLDMNLKAFYKERGYIQAQVGEPVTRIFEGSRGFVPVARKTKQQFYVEVPIEAGDQYRVHKLTVKDSKLFPPDVLEKAFGLQQGDVANLRKVNATLDQIRKWYGNLGYINMSCLPDYRIDEKKKTIDLTFAIHDDKQFFVEQINFSGNTKTRDKVLRREFIIEEEKVFSAAALETSVLKLNQLGFFERIEEKDYNVKPDPNTALVTVDVRVKERSQQTIGVTGGVSGVSGSFLGLTYSTNNFRGRGESLEFSVTAGTRTTDFIASFTEPYLLDTRTSMGISLFNQRLRFDTFSALGPASVAAGGPTELFTRRTTGATLTLSRPIGQSFWRTGGSYTCQKIGIRDIAPGFEDFALGQFASFAPDGDARAALQGIIRSEFTPMLTHDSTDHRFNPTRGWSLNVSAGMAGGVLGGDFNVIRPGVEYRHFFPDRWITNGRNTIGFRLLGEYIQAFGNPAVPFFDRFFIGGETTIRGFDLRSVSPLAIISLLDNAGNPIIDADTGLPKTSAPFPVGGDTMGVFNFEYRVPIAGPLSLTAFYDTGFSRVTRPTGLGSFGRSTLDLLPFTNSVLRSSTGAEVQFLLPIIGAPFRLIFAYNPQRLTIDGKVGTLLLRSKEPRGDIKFTIGRSF